MKSANVSLPNSKEIIRWYNFCELIKISVTEKRLNIWELSHSHFSYEGSLWMKVHTVSLARTWNTCDFWRRRIENVLEYWWLYSKRYSCVKCFITRLLFFICCCFHSFPLSLIFSGRRKRKSPKNSYYVVLFWISFCMKLTPPIRERSGFKKKEISIQKIMKFLACNKKFYLNVLKQRVNNKTMISLNG